MAENVRERGVERAPMLSDSASNRHYTSHRGICFHGITYNVAEGLCSGTTKTILDDISLVDIIFLVCKPCFRCIIIMIIIGEPQILGLMQ